MSIQLIYFVSLHRLLALAFQCIGLSMGQQPMANRQTTIAFNIQTILMQNQLLCIFMARLSHSRWQALCLLRSFFRWSTAAIVIDCCDYFVASFSPLTVNCWRECVRNVFLPLIAREERKYSSVVYRFPNENGEILIAERETQILRHFHLSNIISTASSIPSSVFIFIFVANFLLGCSLHRHCWRLRFSFQLHRDRHPFSEKPQLFAAISRAQALGSRARGMVKERWKRERAHRKGGMAKIKGRAGGEGGRCRQHQKGMGVAMLLLLFVPNFLNGFIWRVRASLLTRTLLPLSMRSSTIAVHSHCSSQRCFVSMQRRKNGTSRAIECESFYFVSLIRTARTSAEKLVPLIKTDLVVETEMRNFSIYANERRRQAARFTGTSHRFESISFYIFIMLICVTYEINYRVMASHSHTHWWWLLFPIPHEKLISNDFRSDRNRFRSPSHFRPFRSHRRDSPLKLKPNIGLDIPRNLFVYVLSAAVRCACVRVCFVAFMTVWQKRDTMLHGDKQAIFIMRKDIWQNRDEQKDSLWLMHAYRVSCAQANEHATHTHTIYKIGKSTANGPKRTPIKRRKFNKLIVLCENECAGASFRCAHRLTAIPAALVTTMCHGFLRISFFCYFLLCGVAFDAQPRCGID